MDGLLVNASGSVSGQVRREYKDGREYLVAPISMIVPGVLAGSQGPIFYPHDEVAKDPHKWDGMPLLGYHPQTVNGQQVSASHTGILDKQGIGYVKGSHVNKMRNGALQGEGWFDVERTRRVDKRILENLEAGKPIELSTGLYIRKKEPAAPGANHNGSGYEWIGRDYQPDHVAVLPDQIGACSIRDGCGVLVNKAADKPTLKWVDFIRFKNKSGTSCSNCMHEKNGKCSFHGTVNNRQVDLRGLSVYSDTCCDAWDSPDTVHLGEQGVHNNLLQPVVVNGETLYRLIGNASQPSDHIDPDKACQILHDGTAQGHPLTEEQRKMFGAACGHPDTHNAEKTPKEVETPNPTPAKPTVEIKPPRVGSAEAGKEEDEYQDKLNDIHESSGATMNEYNTFLLYNAKWDDAARQRLAQTAPEDFAGPNLSFPITDNQDLSCAVTLLHHADDPLAVSNSINAIAERKGLSFVANEHIGFQEMTEKLEDKGHDEESAKAIAAAIGRKKYGKKGMAEKAAAGRKAAETHNTRNGAVPMTLEQLDKIIANCQCQTTKGQLVAARQKLVNNSPLKSPENMDDEELRDHHKRVVSEVARRHAGMDADDGGRDAEGEAEEGYSEPDEGSEVANDVEMHSFDGKPVKSSEIQAGGKGVKSEYQQNASINEWLRKTNAPESVWQIIGNARKVEQGTKLRIVRGLVANVRNKEQRHALGNKLMRKSLGELQEMSLLVGNRAVSVPAAAPDAPLYIGTAPATNSSLSPVPVENVEQPSLNYSEMASPGLMAVLGKKTA